MVLKLPKSVLEGLPSPDSKGLVRVSIALRMDGSKARVAEINDMPTDSSDNGEEEEDPAGPVDEAAPAPDTADLDEAAGDMPSPQDVASQILAP